jgi:hypothetical protein
MNMLSPVAVLLSALLTFHLTSATAQENSKKPEVLFKVTALSPEYEPTQVRNKAAKLSLSLKATFGELYFTRSAEQFLLRSIEPTSSLNFAQDQLTDGLDFRASPLSSRERDAGLKIEPSNARLSRLFPTMYDATSGKLVAIGAFLTIDSRKQVMPVYFNGPTKVSGTVRTATGTLENYVEIPSEGVHWLLIDVQSGARTTVRLIDWPRVVLLGVPSMAFEEAK